MAELEAWGAAHGHQEAWVASEDAEAFYRRCGWARQEEFITRHGDHAVVLHKELVG